MVNIFKKALLSTVVFGMAIASGFAMDNNPPNEPIKKVLETEVVTEEAPEQATPIMAYRDALGNCVLVYTGIAPTGCSEISGTIACTSFIAGATRHLRELVFDNDTEEWTCGALLYKINP